MKSTSKLPKQALAEGNFIPLDELVKELGIEEGADKDVQS